ncbi:MAG: hypothetical protein ACNA8K_03055 [Cyclonatronaceae bacterium]
MTVPMPMPMSMPVPVPISKTLTMALRSIRYSVMTTAAIVIMIHAAYSQDTQRAVQNLNSSGATSGNVVVTFNESYYGIEGTPYLVQDFVSGAFHQSGAGRYEEVRIRYNAYEDWLEVIIDSDSLVLKPSAIRSFEFANSGGSHVYRNGFSSPDDGIDRENYLRVMHDGNIVFLKRHIKELKKADFDPVFNIGSRHDQFVDQERYYSAGSGSNLIEPVRMRRRDILNLMSDKSDQIARYVRDNRLNYRSAEDVVKMLEQYDRLKNETGEQIRD